MSSPALSGRSLSLLLLVFAVIASGCAHGYSAIPTQSSQYGTPTESGPLTFEYRLNALESAGNGGFAKKSRKKNVAPIPLRVTNNSSEAITLHRALLDVTSKAASPYLVPAQKAANDLGQAYGWHILWGLLNVYYTSSEGKTTWLPVGPVIGVFNIIRGAVANGNLESDFEKKSLYGETIRPGDTVSGLVFVADGQGQPLEFIYRGDEATARAR